MDELGCVDADSERGVTLLGRLQAAVLRHHEIEEREVLPLLRATVDPHELEGLGASFVSVKGVATAHRPPSADGPATRPDAPVVDPAHDAVQSAFAGIDA